MARRVFEIAKELGIASKAVVTKCHAEGISHDMIKNHMSSVSAGLEETIKEWFSQDAPSTTAIETAEKVDLEKVRVQPKKARAKKKVDVAADEPVASDTATAIAEPPTVAKRIVPAAAPAPEDLPPQEPEQLAPEPAPAKEPETPTIAASQETPDSAPTVVEQAKPAPPAPDAPARTHSPAPMNVPSRPKVIKPAGPKLEIKAPVKLSGPKVVRVEAPDIVEAPRAKRYNNGGPSIPSTRGPRSGSGVPSAPMSAEDDRSRSPRRGGNKRRTTTGAGSGPGTGVPARRRGRANEPGSGAGWSEQDLAERDARLTRSTGYLKQRRRKIKQQQGTSDRPATPAETGGNVKITAPFTINELSATTGIKAGEIVKKLFLQGIAASPNSGIDSAQAQELMIEYDIELEVVEIKTAEQVVTEEFEQRETVDERSRGPVVTILGHVDHGKTSLLDRIRQTDVAAGEAGGITQATSAFRVPVQVGDSEKQVVFVDTPGHEAFTSMRARGANVTDIVVLVVAADDGVMPQTVESISHAKAAGVPIVVALNKIDKPEATDGNIQKILGQLAEHELNPVEWGGSTEVVRTSAVKNEGITDLLEILDYQAQLLDLKADFGGTARGTVIESRHAEGRGPVANILVQDGELSVGDFIVMGRAFGRVRDMTDDRSRRLKTIQPPAPVQISGINELPDAGDRFFVVSSLKKAQEAAQERRTREREIQLAQPKATLDSLFSQMAENEIKEILIVLKADVQGSIDVLKNEIEKVGTDEIKVRVLHAAVGGITESDVLLADASNAIIIGFNVIPAAKARQMAEQKKVEIRTYQVIYHITDDVRKAAEGLLEPELRQEIIGHAEVRQVFKISKVGSIAGCYVTNGTVQRDALIRVTRSDVVIENDRVLEQLKRFKEDAKDVRAGIECGMKIVGYDDIKEGDILECYKNIEVKRTL